MTISREQSIGSSELMRNSRSSRSAKAFARRRRSGSEAGPSNLARTSRDGLPSAAISLKPAAAMRSTSRRASSTAHCASTRVVGMMQYEHGSAQPVWTRNVNAVPSCHSRFDGSAQLPHHHQTLRGRRLQVRLKPDTTHDGGDDGQETGDRQQLGLVVVRHDADDVGQRGDFVGPARRVTAVTTIRADGLVARDATNCLTRALIRRRGHRTVLPQTMWLTRASRGRTSARNSSLSERIGLIDSTSNVITEYFTLNALHPVDTEDAEVKSCVHYSRA